MLVKIDENSATLTPFGSLAGHIPANAPTAESKSWSGLLCSVLAQTRQKRSDEIPADVMRDVPRNMTQPPLRTVERAIVRGGCANLPSTT